METAPADTAAVPTGRWDEAEAKNVADEMIGESMLEGEWLQHWENNHKGRPAVTIHLIRNKTMHHIDEEIFIKDIERHLVNSDKVRFMRFWNNERIQLRCGGAPVRTDGASSCQKEGSP